LVHGARLGSATDIFRQENIVVAGSAEQSHAQKPASSMALRRRTKSAVLPPQARKESHKLRLFWEPGVDSGL
jgi:hypothetical protein